MKDNFFSEIDKFWQANVIEYIKILQDNPLRLILFFIDLAIVIFLVYKFIKMTKSSRVWQLIKGIAVLIIVTLVSGWLHLDILHTILTSIMTYGVIAMIVIFQPELRAGLEHIGRANFNLIGKNSDNEEIKKLEKKFIIFYK